MIIVMRFPRTASPSLISYNYAALDFITCVFSRINANCCGVTKLDTIRNERIRGTTKVGEITKKVQERRLKWDGHVMRREEHYV